jgi:nicotinamidase-related amidase
MTVTSIDSSSALVIIDLQNALVSAPTAPYSGTEVVARAVELARAFHEHRAPVALVRVTARADGLDAAPGRIEALTQRGSLPDGWDAIVDDLAGHPDDITVTKRTWSAFHGTDLDLQLRRRGSTQIVLAGLTTSVGVESTARAAYEHGYHVTLATDAMADLDLEAHRNSVERIFPLLGQTGSTAAIVKMFAEART